MRKPSPALQAQLDKIAAMPAKVREKSCKQYAESGKEKLAKADALSKENAAKRKDALAKAQTQTAGKLSKHAAEIKHEAAAANVELTCKVPKAAKRKAAAPKPAKRKATKKAAKKVTAKKTTRKATKKATVKHAPKKASKRGGKKGPRSPIVQIGGVEYDRKMLNAAKRATGAGDHRISIHDASKLLKHVEDGRKYTDIEKATMAYIRDHFKFTPEADEWLRSQIASDAAVKAAKTRAKGTAKKAAKKAPKRASKKAAKKKAAKKGKRAAKAGAKKAPKKAGKKRGKRGPKGANVDISLQATIPATPATPKKRAKKAARIAVSSQGVDAAADQDLMKGFASALAEVEKGEAANEALPRRGKRDGRKKARRTITEACPSRDMGY